VTKKKLFPILVILQVFQLGCGNNELLTGSNLHNLFAVVSVIILSLEVLQYTVCYG
jgi:hypothetical protein